MQMKITTTQTEYSTIVTLTGRFDASAADVFKSFITTPEANWTGNYVVDLSDVPYIDSGALGSLVLFLRQVKEHGGNIRIAALSRKVIAVFELTRLHRIFDIYDDPNTASKSFLTVATAT